MWLLRVEGGMGPWSVLSQTSRSKRGRRRRKANIGVSYMDDFLIGSLNTKQGQKDHSLMHPWPSCQDGLKKYYLRPAKCYGCHRPMDLLGMKIEEGGTMRINPTKLDGMHKWPRTGKTKRTYKEHGCPTVQQAFVPGFSHMARLSSRRSRKGPNSVDPRQLS